MKYTCRMQTGQSYSGRTYGTNTIGESACGPASLVNALLQLGVADVSVPDMCAFSVSVGARIPNEGTDMYRLLDSASSKYGFTYATTNYNKVAYEHLKKGGTVIANVSSVYPWFSKGGHYIALLDTYGSNDVVVGDSYYYDGKWDVFVGSSRRSSKITPYPGASFTNNQVLVTSMDIVGKATIGPPTCYYLISKKRKTVRITDKCSLYEDSSKDSAVIGEVTGTAPVKVELLKETKNWVKVGVWVPKKHTNLK